MRYQLRIYTVKPGEMDEWIDEWSRNVRPLRERFGFEVLGPWVIEDEDRFVWILGYEGDWDAADRAYYNSEARKSVSPEPTRHLADTQHHRMRRV
jgi:NIPSNAP